MTDTRIALSRTSFYTSLLLVVVGLTIIAGWEFRIPIMRGQAFGTFVAPNTALSFALSGLSILLLKSDGHKRQLLGKLAALFVLAFALATAVEYLFKIDLGIDGILMSHRLSDWSLPTPGRYSVNSVVGFLLTGVGLLTLRRESGWPWAEIFAAFVMLVSYLSIVAYLLGASVLYDHVMAIHTAVLFGVLAIALASSANRHVLLGIVLSPFAGAIASRKMILAVVFLLPLFGAFEVWAELSGVFSIRLGAAVFVITSVLVFTIFALRTAAVLNETDQKRLETEGALLRSSQIATAGRMAASIAHEVNNPLEAVTNIIYLLKSGELPDDQRRKYLDIAEKELTRVSAIARRTLGFYREDAQEVEIDLRDMIDSVITVYRNKIPDSVVISLNFCDNPYIVAKSGEVRQVMMNLLANAIDALPANAGQLKISVTADHEVLRIGIKDNGHGIPKETLPHIFEPFFTTKKEFGTGLGLWVSKELVIKNNGAIRVYSSTDATNHGTMFEVTFPASPLAAIHSVPLAESKRAS